MFALIEAAGWPIWPLLLASVISLAIIGERAWSLRSSIVAPKNLLNEVTQEFQQHGVSQQLVAPLDDAGRSAAHELERFLNTLGTIASISPLLGLLGTVIGMIEIFGSQAPSGSNPIALAHGISVALYNTAIGLVVSIPSMIFYRYFRGHIDSLIVEMESQAVRLVEILHGNRQN